VLLNASPALAREASAGFCQDTSQLQTWFGTKFYAGVDQYQYNPLPTNEAGLDAAYLRKLAAEAPPMARADLNAWAAYTQEVADNASPTHLAAGAPAAKAAADRVKAWLASAASGCKPMYEAARFPAAGHPKKSYAGWIIGGVVALVVLWAIAAMAGSGSKTTELTADGWKSGGGSSPSPDRTPYTPATMPRPRCTRCSGSRRITHSLCNGSGRVSTGHPNETMTCFPCSGSGQITCDSCRGTGIQ
jgi:hypothetical protein